MSGPHDPQQHQQWPPPEGHPPAGYPPAGYPPAGYQQAWGYQPAGYQPAGYQQGGYQPWAPPPDRPGVLIAAGVLWLLNGAFLLVFGVLTAVADRLPGFNDAMRDRDTEVTREQLLAVGITGAVLGAAIIALGVVVFSGATWARILVMVLAVVPTAFLLVLVIFPLFTIAASVLQFLPPVGRYLHAKRARARAGA